MSATITADITAMFSRYEPWDVSNSVENLGPRAGELTWQCALEIAAQHERWLLSPLADACEGMREWAASTGAWDRAEVAAMSDSELLGMFAQNIAAELRMLGSDDADLATCVAKYSATNWEREAEYPSGSYYTEADGALRVDYYTGV